MKRWMSMVFLFCGLLGAQAAWAESKAVYEWSQGRYLKYYFGTSEYRFDAKAGTAKLMLKFCFPIDMPGFDNSWISSESCDTAWTAVAGLSYDAQSAQILYQGEDGKKAVCATVVEKRGMFGRRYSLIRPTKECRIFAKESRQKIEVFFEAP